MIDINIKLPNVAEPVHPSAKLRELLTPLPQPHHYLLVLDNSALEYVTRCPTSAAYYLVHKREAHAKNAALIFGGALHEGIKGYLLGEPSELQEQRVLKYFTENPPPPDEYRTPPLALQVLKHYRVRCEFPDYDMAILSDGAPIIERPFEVPLGVLNVNTSLRLPDWPEPRFVESIHIAWSGRIDLVATALRLNRVGDHKTTSIAGDQFVQGFQLSNQAMGYVWAAQQLWPNLDITGFCLDAIHLKRPSNGAVNLMSKGPRGGEGPLNFFRAYFEYSAERLLQWEQNTMVMIEDFVHCIIRNEYPMFTNNCFNKYGRCQYFDVCTIDNPQVRQRFLQSDAFRDVTWSPTL